MSSLSVFETANSSTGRSPVVCQPLDSVDLSSVRDPSLTEVVLTGLESDIDYTATVYSQAADGTEGQPGDEAVFKTSRLEFVEWLQLESPPPP